MGAELRVLGQVELWVDGRFVQVGHARQTCVLAVLVVEANRVVTMEQLLNRVWADRLPYKARSVASNYVSRLRRVLAGELAVVRRAGGYVLEVDPEAVDLHRFRRLVRQASSADDDARALALLEEAAGLWRGEPFAGLDTPWLAAVRTGLERERIAARLDRVDVALRCGRHTEVLPELFALAEQEDVDERVAAQFMLALHRAGRTTDALAHYRQLRARLIEQLGTEPGTALQDLHQRILDTDPALTPPSAAIMRGTATKMEKPVPRQLPALPRWFTGRDAELARLDQALTTEPEEDPLPRGSSSGTPASATVMISAIGGAGGTGKTWLALAWAHHHLDRFADGQLFVDLRGFSPTQEPMASEVAVRGFLDALGIDSGRIPADLDAQAALYRTLVAGRRMLIVLDNAATADQIVPLLPGSPTCTVLVTGRTRLASLIDRHGTRHLTLDVLDRTEARALLAARLGASRAAAEPAAVDELVELCGGYPLALSIAARNAATRPGLPLAEVAGELRELGLQVLDHDSDPAASLPTVLSWSLRRLTDEQRTVFALLGIAPGPDTTLPAVIALTGLPPARARKALSALEEASLLERRPHGRYAMHDLIRAYATTTAHDLPGDLRETALVRVMDFHLHTAHAADRLLDPHRHLLKAPDPPVAGVHPHPLPDAAAAIAWLEVEHATLLATQRAAVALSRHHVVWHLARTLDTFHLRRALLRDALAAWRAAVDAAAHLSDPAARSLAHRFLGRVCSRLGLHEEATCNLNRAIDLAKRHRDLTGQAHTHQALAAAWERRGDDRRALDHARHALDLYRTLDHQEWEADALNLVGWYAARLSEFDTALDHCRGALALHRRHRHPDGEAAALDSLGFIAHHTGEHWKAVKRYHRALTIFRSLGNTYEVADTLDHLGHPHAALGQHDQARKAWQEALELYRQQGRGDAAARVRRQLDGLGSAMQSIRPSGAGETT
ncbi:DNA-binding SARP family transcriptional activator/tetratricopeptide (TPR) repeat protein [Lentzea nigeriaca]|uniref:AfsR/SARP family transcriptional regulator n=1 Tax=Lentzea nigeriaca TaxID=1128665 RepID=UPI001959D2B7|nr:BTAD domain-containing putative transcriptional regulator [Lentzea nigeriaca]MBM7857313.1 DNA-binding SARP family transcriptional activator/tetratricopeptide (TPR) repeat protein [Lentzea nigeriaca]